MATVVATLDMSVSATLATSTKSITPPRVTINGTVGEFDKVNLPAGNTTVNPPAGTTYVVGVLPPTGAVMTLKGVNGDTGVLILNSGISAANPTWFVIPFAGNTFVVNCSVPVPGIEIAYL